MRTRVDQELIREGKALRLRFACPDCAFFETGTRACAEGYPNDAHRDVTLETAMTLEFCKSFELV